MSRDSRLRLSGATLRHGAPGHQDTTARSSALTGRTALVTGAAQGIGEAIARALVASGASVALSDVDGEAVETAARAAVSKAGIIALTKVAAADLAGASVTVNSLAPTVIEGPAMDAPPAELREQLPARIPVGRVGTLDGVAALAVFLCRDEAAYMTGATLDVNGRLFMR